jgi:hypothetical protein
MLSKLLKIKRNTEESTNKASSRTLAPQLHTSIAKDSFLGDTMNRRFLAVLFLLISICATSAMADSLSISFASGFQGGVTLSNNGSGGINFAFSNANVSGATPIFDSLNSFPNNPFTIGPGIVLNGASAFTTSSTSVQIGNSDSTMAGLLTGNINFITISQTNGSPGAFAINISLTNVDYSCADGCVSSNVLSSLAFGAAGNLTFTFGFTNGPQTMDDLLAIASTPDSTFKSAGYTGTINTVPEPASLALFGSGMLAGGSFVRRKFKK